MGATVKLGDELVRLDQGRLQVDLLEQELAFVQAVSARLSAEVYSTEKVAYPDQLISGTAESATLKALIKEQNEIFFYRSRKRASESRPIEE